MFTRQEIADICIYYGARVSCRPTVTEDEIHFADWGHEWRIIKHDDGPGVVLLNDDEDFEEGIFAASVDELLKSLAALDSDY